MPVVAQTHLLLILRVYTDGHKVKIKINKDQVPTHLHDLVPFLCPASLIESQLPSAVMLSVPASLHNSN